MLQLRFGHKLGRALPTACQFAIAVLILTISSTALCQDNLAGREVMIIRSCELKAGAKVVGRSSFGDTFRVDKVNGDWLWIESKKGYVRRADVVLPERALEHLNSQIGSEPSAERYAYRGWLLHLRGDLDKALGDCNKAVAMDPKFPLARVNRGHVLWHLDRFDQALEDLQEAIRLRPDSPPGHAYLADVWYAKGDFDKARTEYLEAVRLDPQDAGIHGYLATFYATALSKKHRDGKAAVALATKACEMTSWKDAKHIGILASAFAETGEFDRAIEHLRKALELVPASSRKKLEERLALFESKRPYRDEKPLKTFVEVQNAKADALVQKKDYKAARQIYEEILELQPTNRHALLEHADTFYAEDQYQKAIVGYDKVIAVHPKDINVFHWRGDAWAKLSEHQKAIEDYTRAIELNPQNTAAFGERGKSYAKLGKRSESIVDFTIAIHLSSNDALRAFYRSLRGEIFQQNGDEVAAAGDFAVAARLQPTNAQYWLQSARLLATSPDDSIRDGQTAIEEAYQAVRARSAANAIPQSQELDVLAAAYAESGKFAIAVTLQEKAVQSATTESSKSELRSRLELYKAEKPYRVPRVPSNG